MKFDNEKHHDLYCVTKYYLGDQIKMNEWGRVCSTYVCVGGRGGGEREGVAYSSFFLGWGGLERLGSLGTPKCRWDNNTKRILQK